MLLLLLFAFIAGIVTILSPCILPVLPIILSGSVTGGRRRPLGIVTGFIVSFTIFTLFLSTLVSLTGISADSLRYISIITLMLFGLTLISTRMQLYIEKLFSTLSNRAPKNDTKREGFSGGVIVGLSLGLLWTPCVGPILASVISLALTGTVTTATFFITLAYALGTAVPMLAITYGGKALLQKTPWLVSHTVYIQKIFGVLMIVVAVLIYLNIDRQFQTYILEKFPQYGAGLTQFEDNENVRRILDGLQKKGDNKNNIGKPMNDFYTQAPELIPGGEWFNSKPLKITELKGKVVLVDFWTYTCINCIRTLPYLKDWYSTYKDQGFVIIGVHTPEFEFEKNKDNVQKAIKDFNLTYPIVQDNNYRTWNAYNNRYWPAKYFIDTNGRIRKTHFGEGNYDESERFIQTLLKEKGEKVDKSAIKNPNYDIYSRTPELYLGYGRIAHFSSPEEITRDKFESYSTPSDIPQNTFALKGKWLVAKENAQGEKGNIITLSFESRNVFAVMRSKNKTPVRVQILLDGKKPGSYAGDDVKDGNVFVTEDKLYNLLQLDTPGKHTLEIKLLDSGLEIFAFTFG